MPHGIGMDIELNIYSIRYNVSITFESFSNMYLENSNSQLIRLKMANANRVQIRAKAKSISIFNTHFVNYSTHCY